MNTDERIGKIEITVYSDKGREKKEDLIVEELPLTIYLNEDEIATLLCTPQDLKYLAVGFLFSEGILNSKEEVKNIILDERKGLAWVEADKDKDFVKKLINKRLITSGCGKGASFYSVADSILSQKIKSDLSISFKQVLSLAQELQDRSELYKSTGGVHSAALCTEDKVVLFCEDIGRHNAIDKIFGKCLLTDMALNDKIIISSGRVSSEILLKVAKRSIPILISRSAPTKMAVGLAEKLGITLIGFARGKRMNVYANEYRVLN